MEGSTDGGGDISVLIPGNGTARPVVRTPATEWGAKLSPDGRWIAYVSNQSGQWEVFLEPFPGPGTRRPVSVAGGTEVVWARSGQELFYRNGALMMAVPIRSTGDNISVGSARRLWDGPYEHGSPGGHNYDVTPDGSRFLMIRAADADASGRVLVTLNWFEELKRLVSTK
jgi:Tol biopolymer transport system component